MAAPGIVSQQDIDDIIIRYADTLTPAQISFKLEGVLSPEQVLTRRGLLCEAPDKLTALQQEQLTVQKLRRLIVQLEEMMANTPTARTAEVLGSQLERLLNRLDKREAASEKELHTLYAFQGAVLLDGVTASLDYMKTQIASKGMPKTPDDWDALLSASIRYAQFEINRHEPGAEALSTKEEDVIDAEVVEDAPLPVLKQEAKVLVSGNFDPRELD